MERKWLILRRSFHFRIGWESEKWRKTAWKFNGMSCQTSFWKIWKCCRSKTRMEIVELYCVSNFICMGKMWMWWMYNWSSKPSKKTQSKCICILVWLIWFELQPLFENENTRTPTLVHKMFRNENRYLFFNFQIDWTKIATEKLFFPQNVLLPEYVDVPGEKDRNKRANNSGQVSVWEACVWFDDYWFFPIINAMLQHWFIMSRAVCVSEPKMTMTTTTQVDPSSPC